MPPVRPYGPKKARPLTGSRASIFSMKFMVEGFSIILAAGFIISIVLNSLIFLMWGISFAQVSTTNDVINSGLQLTALLAACSATYFTSISIGLKRDTKARNRLKSAVIVVMIIVTGFALWVDGVDIQFIARSKEIDLSVAQLIIAAHRIGAIITVFTILVSTSILSGLEDCESNAFREKRTHFAAAVAVLLVSLLIVSVTASVGYLGGGYFLRPPNIPNFCDGEVLWVGERAIVARCKPNDRPMVLLAPENAIIIPIGVHEQTASDVR
ncbi:hypothetical protein [Caulobacter sp. Root1455]|uniref:hypothetical protein n=1 Tax=Caulobacter sp. Root1455 TaxID=1736465 RepID=UPI000A75D5FE|nr:hypothetical protein [Caulobacter sp. Root1455]